MRRLRTKMVFFSHAIIPAQAAVNVGGTLVPLRPFRRVHFISARAAMFAPGANRLFVQADVSHCAGCAGRAWCLRHSRAASLREPLSTVKHKTKMVFFGG